jgi:hypothetical protein
MPEGFAKTPNLTTDDTDNTDLHGSRQIAKTAEHCQKIQIEKLNPPKFIVGFGRSLPAIFGNFGISGNCLIRTHPW